MCPLRLRRLVVHIWSSLIITSFCPHIQQTLLEIVYIIHSFIHSFIHSRIYKASLQEIYSEAPPSPSKAIQISLKQPAKRTFINFRQDTHFQGESIPSGGTNNGECATLPSCSFSMRHQ